MQVILLEKVGKLGTIGDKVNVKSGYGRNYLIPNGKAVFATDANIAEFESRRAELEKAVADVLAAAQARAAKLEAVEITIEANASEEGKLFGSVGTDAIAEALAETGAEVVKSEVRLPEGALRDLGEYEVDIQLHSEVTVAIKLAVVAQA